MASTELRRTPKEDAMTKVTAATITTAQIRRLSSEAQQAGDTRMAEWCDVALAYGERYDSVGFPLVSPGTGLACTRTDAREVCADAINDAAMAD